MSAVLIPTVRPVLPRLAARVRVWWLHKRLNAASDQFVTHVSAIADMQRKVEAVERQAEFDSEGIDRIKRQIKQAEAAL